MSAKRRHSGLTLTEMAVVIAVMALLFGVALPAVRMVIRSFESGESVTGMISSTLAAARALAASKGNYVGIRFQKAYNPDAADPLNPLTASQYMIFIVHDPDAEPEGTGLANGFRALEGFKPIKLPDSIGVMDLILVHRTGPTTFTEEVIDTDIEIDTLDELRETTTFSVIFSPSGRLLVHEVRVRNRDGRRDGASPVSLDDVFNTDAQITHPTDPYGMFYQDDYPAVGLGQEYSRNSLVIYDRAKFRRAFERGSAWSDYLFILASDAIHLNPYTGTIISKD